MSDVDLVWMTSDVEALLSEDMLYSAVARPKNKIHYRWNTITAVIVACNTSEAAMSMQKAAVEYWASRFMIKKNLWWIDQNFLFDFFKDKPYKNILISIGDFVKFVK